MWELVILGASNIIYRRGDMIVLALIDKSQRNTIIYFLQASLHMQLWMQFLSRSLMQLFSQV